ncbi:MAG TPA: MFS transporter [Gammaproteobacteria bacterium]|jgi:MFS family permease|nr:MFS transporter [Gammaproteobacteria bacterium]
MSASKLLPGERRAALSLAGIFALRMFGLFMIYPVFAVYARSLPDATPVRVGLALGIYGLAQAVFQMPLGLLSDRVGRKPIIAAGLLVFALGSVVAGLAHSLDGIALGRFLQGMGAVGSAVLALAADLSREGQRTKVMAVIGVTIGLAFGLALVTGPLLEGWFGVPGMFWLTAVLAGIAILVLYAAVPQPELSEVHAETEAVPALLLRVLKDPVLLRLDFGILAQHAILTATFLSVPLVLQGAGIAAGREWRLYLPVLVISVLAMSPMILLAERRGHMRGMMLAAVTAMGLAQLGFMAHVGGLWLLAAALTLFFAAFNFLEAVLPSLISRLAPGKARGTAMGIYSSAQFLGIFLGGVVGGWCQARFGLAGGFGFSLVMACLWLVTAWPVQAPGGDGSPRSK